MADSDNARRGVAAKQRSYQRVSDAIFALMDTRMASQPFFRPVC
jgi:hypothetical protein